MYLNNIVGIFLVLISLSLKTQAQNVLVDDKLKECIEENREQLNVQLHKQVLISGEHLHYRIISPNGYSPSSNIAYFTLRNINQQEVFHWRTPALSDECHGQIVLPDTLSTGYYTLLYYTNFMRNFDPSYLPAIPLIITRINEKNPDFIEIPKKVHDHLNPVGRQGQNDASINLQLSKSQYQPREKVDLIMNIPKQPKTDSSLVSVSIHEKTPFDDLLYAFGSNRNNFEDAPVKRDAPVYKKEVGVFTLSGRIVEKESQKPLSNALISASYRDTIPRFSYTHTNNNGMFNLALDKHYDGKILVSQVHNTPFKAFEVEWQMDNKQITAPRHHEQTLDYPLTQAQKDYLDRLRKTELVKRIYNNRKEVQTKSTQKIEPFPIQHEQVVYPAEFETLENFAEIASNIVYGVRFGKKQDDYVLAMVMSESQRVHDQGAMVFVDGIPFTNLEYIASLGTKDIERIEASNHEFMYGDLTFYGVLSIFTHNQDINPSSYGNPYYLFDNQVNSQSSATYANAEKVSMPLINPHVYWNPYITITGSEKVKLHFKAPDISSDYVIRIEGIDDNGEPIYYKSEFKVR